MTAETLTWGVADWLSHLEAIHPTEIDMGLGRVAQVAARLGCLRPAPLVVLVGGTNGKGTTTALLSALLQAQGMTVGMYNSPHIHLYNERVSVNGNHISDEDLCRSFAAVEAVRGDTTLTYFEFGTLAALWHFAQQSLDAVVLEIGLGGRLDAVNIVDADISVVTSIGLDHQAWLGDTVEQIAYEKCSIARSGRWLVCGQEGAPASARETVSAIGGRWCGAGDDFSALAQECGLTVRYTAGDGERHISFSQCAVPYPNVATALQTLALLGRLPDEALVRQVVEGLRVPGRMQAFRRGELTLILDVAHNPQAAAYLRERLPEVDQIVLGMLADKDVAGVLSFMPQSPRLVVCGLDCARGLSATTIAQRASEAGGQVAGQYDQVAAALDALPARGVVLVAGSFYTVEAAVLWLEQQGDAWSSI